MAHLFFIIAILAVAFLLWFGLHRQITRLVRFRESGLAYFKALLRQRGVDLSRIPDAVLFDIIKAKIMKIRQEAACQGSLKGIRPANSWRVKLARALETEADLIVLLMAEGPDRSPLSDAAISLTKHGVFAKPKIAHQPAFTPQSFAEASQRGTLYAELSARMSLREKS